jgi:hypothetical protein
MIVQLTEEEWQKRREEIIAQVAEACRSGNLPNTDLFNNTDYDVIRDIMDIHDDLEHLKATCKINEQLVEENRQLKQEISPLNKAINGEEIPTGLPPVLPPPQKKKWWKK